MTADPAAHGVAGPASGPAALAEPAFPAEEYAQRLFTTRAAMERRGFDALLVTAPEDVHYLCGLDHQGHFALTALLVPLYGRPVLLERAMETPTALAQTHGVAHHGYDDAGDPADALLEALTPLLPDAPVVGYQADSLSLPPTAWDRLRTAAGILWTDCQDLLGGQRAVHTPREIARIREAARLSDTAMAAGLDAARAGAGEHEIAAAVYAAMLTAGGDLPAFAPLVRDTGRLDREHLTWSRRRLGPGDGVFLELSAARGRYHAPLARLRPAPGPGAPEGGRAAETSRAAMDALCAALRPGATAERVFHTWRAVIERATGIPYERHHCGYLVGIGFPPGWMGGTRTLRPGNTMELRAGMTFHIQSWLLDTPLGTYAFSDTALVTEDGCEVLTRTPHPE
ncbi:M24 family metallopeptidase [Streptomyces sp. XC 2026]|uniref:M24 family metallopeptidase n=1 Tax=Streptomyces sp. XC 2026 TaxID=2782004 RepID=UPI001907C7C1|nr:Xaa-Pro peptidase family protein [Streptomyces sp. XC 2026]QQN77172.1 aminopeptidase P family protein [Streptomyces sp. XC 2026]